ncbi:MAG: helix-turn-helix domain-containing protein [Ruminococcaceae bacterium]|nr:helix-turn-helix domain-containing protein [Oscillospiraceae bacterium]
MANYIGTKLRNDFTVGKLYSVHYFEYPTNFVFDGEKHDFWEVVYVDKGDISVIADDRQFCVTQGNAVFHKPNEWHTLQTSSESATNVVIISFEISSSLMEFFNEKVLSVGQEQKIIFSKVISEYTNAFQTHSNTPYSTRLHRKKNPVVGSEQLIKQYIAELLISFIRYGEPSLQRSQMSINRESALCNMIVNYMLDHISGNITIDELVRYSGSNKTTIAKVFRNSFNMSIMEYFINIKVDAAKKYLREDNYNISQISDLLGYSGIHYFSRQFKKVTGMSPTEYSASIQAMITK